MFPWLGIFIGGGLGSLCRYGLSDYFNTNNFFPLGTLLANFVACLILGIILGVEIKNGPLNGNTRLALITGFCGGFSTFSSYSAETFQLVEQGAYSTAVGYALGSVVICFIAIGVGIFVSRMF